MEDLPSDVQSDILSYIPDNYIVSCKLVSRTWRSLLSHRKHAGSLLVYIAKRTISDVKFRFAYYDDIVSRGDKDDDQKRSKETLTKNTLDRECVCFTSNLIGSCNGLVCLSQHHDLFNRVYNDYVFNPVTGECFNLPPIDNKQGHKDIIKVSGFGYDGKNYKVVRIQYPLLHTEESYSRSKKGWVYIYTLGGGDSSGWRYLGEINYAFNSPGILWNGSLHWLEVDNNHQRKNVIAFDLADETFRYLPTIPQGNEDITHLKVLGGYLSIVTEDPRSEDRSIWSTVSTNIWLFKDNIVVVDKGYESWTWSLEFSIQPVRYSHWYKYDTCEPFAISKNNQIFLWFRMWSGCNSPPVLCRYDPKTDTINALNKILDWGAYYDLMGRYGIREFQGIPHVNSLVSLKALGVDSKTAAEFVAERI